MFTNPRYMSRIIWGGFFLLLLLVFIIPRIDVSRHDDSPRTLATPNPFHDNIIEAEELLHQGRLDELDPDEAHRIAPLLKARALAQAGPISPQEMNIAVDLIDEYRPQIAGQDTEASRATLRNHRNTLILEALPRLDPDLTRTSLNDVRQAYLDAFDIDPSLSR